MTTTCRPTTAAGSGQLRPDATRNRFRIFNPVTQSQRFDPDGALIRRHAPEVAALPAPHIHAPWKMQPSQQREPGVAVGRDYPQPIVNHDVARKIRLALYGVSGGPETR